MNEIDVKELAETVKAGFKEVFGQIKELDGKLTGIAMERAKEAGFELKDKVQKNVSDLEILHQWKIRADETLQKVGTMEGKIDEILLWKQDIAMTVSNNRRMGWIIITAVISLVVAYIGSHFLQGR